MSIPNSYKLFVPVRFVVVSSFNQISNENLKLGYAANNSFYIIYLPWENSFGKVSLPSYEDNGSTFPEHFSMEDGALYANLFEHGQGNFVNLGWFFAHSIPDNLGTLYRKSIDIRLGSQWVYPKSDTSYSNNYGHEMFILTTGVVKTEMIFKTAIGSAVIKVVEDDLRNIISEFHTIRIENKDLVDLEVTLVDPIGKISDKRILISFGRKNLERSRKLFQEMAWQQSGAQYYLSQNPCPRVTNASEWTLS